MEIHGIRPELQPAALAKASENSSKEVSNKEQIKEAVGANHDAPGVDEAKASELTGLGNVLDTQG